MKIVVAVCDTPSVAYIAEKITLSTRVLKGAENASLVAFRDYIAAKYKGKVISEKVVRFEGNKPGLDFTVRVQPAPGQAGLLRVREYLAGQAIYILIAASVINRDLPEDIGKFFGSFAIGTKRVKKTGPKDDVTGKEVAGWGTAYDADGDCQINAEGKALIVSIPGTLHDLNADIDKYNAPRVLTEVQGDFEITVKVVGDFKPGSQATRKGTYPYTGGGIVVWRDGDNFIRLERGAILKQGKINTFSIFEEREGGSRGAVHNGADAGHGLSAAGPPRQPDLRAHQQGRPALDAAQADRHRLARRAQGRPRRHQLEQRAVHGPIRGLLVQDRPIRGRRAGTGRGPQTRPEAVIGRRIPITAA